MQWAGLVDQYFAAVFLPDEPEQVAMVTLRNAIEIPKDLNKPDPNQKLRVEVLGAAVGNPAGISRGRVFVGPKAVDVLESVHATPVAGASAPPDLRGLVDFGFFGIIARPLFLWLRWTHEWVHNWGWSILVLTLVINIALLPLRLSSTRSALKMQRVQPQVKVIKDKYAKFGLRDPRRAEMNQEISALFKKEGVNPAGGCFPLLIQFPFLIAFYTMLGVAIELRHAPWFWVRDLSSPDPLHILPIGIILSTVAVQKMTPQAGVDPTQQRMMLIMMPVMLGVISWNLASGLCLYWTAGNVIAIIQQYLMNRTKLGREMRQEMEKRARKREKSPVPSK
jgi:YidC/Oxa1 family membrane protein insertase